MRRILEGAPRLRTARLHVEERQRAAVGDLVRFKQAVRSRTVTSGEAPYNERIAAAGKELRAIDDKLTVLSETDRARAEDAMNALRKELMTARSDAEARAMADEIHVTPSARRLESYVRSTAREFFRIVPKTLDPAKIRIISTGRPRASAKLDGTIDVSEPTPYLLFHELGHLLEYGDPDLYTAAVDWRAARSRATFGEPRLRPLRRIDPDVDYAASEIAVEDQFFDPYVGACYEHRGKRTTEVLTTGIQNFTHERYMLDMFMRDPEQFLFVIGAIAP